MSVSTISIWMSLLWYIYNGPLRDLNMKCHLGSLNMNVPLGGLNMISLSVFKIYNGPLGSLNMYDLLGRFNMITLRTIKIFNDPLDILNMMALLEVWIWILLAIKIRNDPLGISNMRRLRLWMSSFINIWYNDRYVWSWYHFYWYLATLGSRY